MITRLRAVYESTEGHDYFFRFSYFFVFSVFVCFPFFLSLSFLVLSLSLTRRTTHDSRHHRSFHALSSSCCINVLVLSNEHSSKLPSKRTKSEKQISSEIIFLEFGDVSGAKTKPPTHKKRGWGPGHLFVVSRGACPHILSRSTLHRLCMIETLLH